MSNTKASILIPFKNTAAYLPACLDSIINQSYKNWEVLIVDDSSTDKSHEIVKVYSQKDARIRLLKNKGVGIIEALQTAYAQSTGTFITRMDSDDIMATNKIECMVADLTLKGPGYIALGLVHYFSESGIKEGYKRYENWLNTLILKGTNFNEIYKECVIPSPCWMVYRRDFEKANGFNSNFYPEDYDLAFRFFENGLQCISSNNVLHSWRDYAVRTSRTSPNYAENSFLELKIHYFLKLSYDPLKTLVIWGAGKKGKKIVSLLKSSKIPFVWICENPKKIGKKIYNEAVESFEKLLEIPNYQSIISVANENAQRKILRIFKAQGKEAMTDYFFFC